MHDDPNQYTVYHQCTGWAIKKGTSGGCTQCRRRQRGRPEATRIVPKARYTYEEAAALIDQCAGCSASIPEDHRYHRCEKCLPAWRKRIARIEGAYLRDYREEVIDDDH